MAEKIIPFLFHVPAPAPLVVLSAGADTCGSFRCGTATATRAELERVLGAPTFTSDDNDDKVKFSWTFRTPRGPAEVGDYWWNAKNEQSIRAANPKAARWLARHLRRLGIPAKCR
jgi:hypothetical protein